MSSCDYPLLFRMINNYDEGRAIPSDLNGETPSIYQSQTRFQRFDQSKL